MKLAVVATGLLPMAGTAQGQSVLTFPITFDQFRQRLDAAIRADTLDKSKPNSFTMRSCTRRNNRYDCSFNDAGFQSALREWRRTGILPVTGPVTQVLQLTATTGGDQVSRIVVTSVRDDMINLLVPYLSTIVAVMRVFEPGIAEGPGEPQRTINQLGIMRGDASPTIGKPMTIEITGAKVSCTNWDSHVSAKVECVFTPL